MHTKPTRQQQRGCLPLLASPKRSFKVLTSEQEKKKNLRAKKNKICQPRALCFPKKVYVWKEEGSGSTSSRPLPSQGSGLLAGNLDLIGACGFSCLPDLGPGLPFGPLLVDSIRGSVKQRALGGCGLQCVVARYSSWRPGVYT